MTAERIATLARSEGRRGLQWTWPLPADCMVAVFDRAADAFAAAGEVEAARGGESIVASGVRGADEIRNATRGVRGWLGRVFDQEPELRPLLADTAASGAAVLLLSVARTDSAATAALLRARGARLIVRSGLWITERVPAAPQQ
jgi:hypothetical protein